MRLKNSLAALGLSATMLGTLGLGLVAAAPSNAPSSSTDTFTCDNGDVVTVVTNGNGNWTPGHVVAINGTETNTIYHPLAFTGVFIPDQPINGQTQITVFSDAKNGNHKGITNTFECSSEPMPVSANDPENPYGVSGSFVFVVTAWESGNSH